MKNSARELYYLLPNTLHSAILVKRRTPVWLRAGIVFVHVPKAAGTSVSDALYGRFLGHVRARDIERWGSAKLRSLPTFAITRNPWDRLVSAYRFAKRGGGVGSTAGRVWKPGRYKMPEFESFDRFVTEWLADSELNTLDYIFQPQANFVTGATGELLVDHVGKLEDLGPTFEFIRQHLGVAPVLAGANRSGAPVDYRRFYTSRLVDLVGRIYARDVEIFSYLFDDD